MGQNKIPIERKGGITRFFRGIETTAPNTNQSFHSYEKYGEFSLSS